MNDFSYWEQKYFWTNSDFVVIGAGITGLTTAVYLKKLRPDARVTILEKGMLPGGASTKNAGFACFGSLSEILDDLNHNGEDAVYSLIEKRLRGLSLLRELLGDKNIAYESAGGYEVFTNADEDSFQQCKNALNSVNAALRPITGCDTFHPADDKIAEQGLGNVKHMLYNGVEGLINTGLMMKNLTALARASGVEILNGAEVLKIEKKAAGLLVHTAVGEMHAGRVCVATNGFAAKLLPSHDVKPCRAQVLITEPIPGLKLHGAFHHNKGYDYFRHLHGRVLFGGGRHLDKGAEDTDAFGTTDLIQSYLEEFLGNVILPDVNPKIDMRWSGIMGMGKAKNVIIEEVSPDLFCAVRFGGMGVALGTAAGREVASLLLS